MFHSNEPLFHLPRRMTMRETGAMNLSSDYSSGLLLVASPSLLCVARPLVLSHIHLCRV